MLTYKVDWVEGPHRNIVKDIDARSRKDAQAKARRISKKIGDCYVVAFENGQSVGHIAYHDGFIVDGSIEGRV